MTNITDLVLNDQMMTLEMTDMLIGDFIGEGISRKTYSCPLNREWVVKVSDPQAYNQNMLEWMIWDECHTHMLDVREWLAPCHFISNGGHVMIQQRTAPVTPCLMPKKVPYFLNSDLKTDNWGLIDGKPVCHDYGYAKVFRLGITNRMVKSDYIPEQHER